MCTVQFSGPFVLCQFKFLVSSEQTVKLKVNSNQLASVKLYASILITLYFNIDVLWVKRCLFLNKTVFFTYKD